MVVPQVRGEPPGGANFVMADGSVRVIGFAVDPEQFLRACALMTDHRFHWIESRDRTARISGVRSSEANVFSWSLCALGL